MCVVVVIHRHEYVRLFGDPAHPRIHLYKKDALTHYDALPPGPAPASAPVGAASLAPTSAVSAVGASPCIVVSETSDDELPIPRITFPIPPPLPLSLRTSARVRATPRMQTGQMSRKPLALSPPGMMVCDGVCWCMVVYGVVVCDGSWWCMVLFISFTHMTPPLGRNAMLSAAAPSAPAPTGMMLWDGVRWCMVWWCVMVHGGVWCCSYTHSARHSKNVVQSNFHTQAQAPDTQ